MTATRPRSQPASADPYELFLEGKLPRPVPSGFKCKASSLPKGLFDWQAEAVIRALHLGRSALFEECGMGKTAQQLAWADAVAKKTNEPVLITAPLAVSRQTKAEGEKFDVPVNICRSGDDVTPGVNITNYERLHLFDAGRFAGIVPDESSILKSFSGTTKRQLVAMFKDTPYKLPCTATPSPNDHMELGNHSEFLGTMPSNEMLARWFINDTSSFGTYRLKGHAENDYWDWVASWAMCLARPSDLTGKAGDDAGFILPELIETVHDIEVDVTEDAGDRLFRVANLSATGMHQEKRRTLLVRAEQSAALANASTEAFIVWCETNDESDLLRHLIPDAVEVRGADSVDAKESKLESFSTGNARVIVTKPSIAGWGLNWQHCANVIFSSLTFSFESYYQAVRRSYRFGQTRPVQVHLMVPQTESGFLDVLRYKRQSHERMQAAMSAANCRAHRGGSYELLRDAGAAVPAVPAWLRA